MTGVVILAGRQGKGENAPFSPCGNSTVIEATLARLEPQAEDVVINAGALDGPNTTRLANLGIPFIFDDLAWHGALGAILNALKWAVRRGETYVITCPCDRPRLPDDAIAQLLAAPDVDCVHFDGDVLFARWRTSLAARLEADLKAGHPRALAEVVQSLAPVVLPGVLP